MRCGTSTTPPSPKPAFAPRSSVIRAHRAKRRRRQPRWHARRDCSESSPTPTRRSTACSVRSMRSRCACASVTCSSAAAATIRVSARRRRSHGSSRRSRGRERHAGGRRLLPRGCAAHAGDRIACRRSRSSGTGARSRRRRRRTTYARAAGAPLLHNLGWTLHDRGEYAAALDCWRQALAAREAAHDVPRARIARWTVARGLRSLGKLDDAEAMQRALAASCRRRTRRRLRVRGARGDCAGARRSVGRAALGGESDRAARRRRRPQGQRCRAPCAAGGARGRPRADRGRSNPREDSSHLPEPTASTAPAGIKSNPMNPQSDARSSSGFRAANPASRRPSSSTVRRSSCWSRSCCRRRRPTRA